ncbi:MAG: hypothetical protein KAJ81_05290 [Candidatus Latescibacteria bacterium]|nr:hypothetical protein [Candidatus Latescibacterota bacterium]
MIHGHDHAILGFFPVVSEGLKAEDIQGIREFGGVPDGQGILIDLCGGGG